MSELSASTPAGTGSPVVVCQRLTKVFKDFWMRDRARAVDSLNLEIRPREVFGLLGPNGSGKSTTIKMILGLLRPSSGRVAIFGKPPTDVFVKSRIGYLPEESYLYPFLDARETLDYYAKLFGLDYRVRKRRTDELLDMVGLAGAQFRQVREYSKGMQRRIGIAQALINDPDLLILDEPTTGLDPVGTKQIKDLIILLGRRGKTILLSSHLLADVEDCVDRMVILYGGKIQREGTCEQLLESQSKTSIETDTLDDDTVAEIDRVVRSRSGGSKSVLKVARPRQRLEDLFLEIVEQARAQQLTNAGAAHGGETASFLRGGEEQDSRAVIDRLVSHAPAAPVIPAPAPAPVAAAPRADEAVIDSLLGRAPAAPARDAERAPAAPARPAPSAPPAGEVDQSVIGSLLSGGNAPSPGSDGEKRPKP